MPKNAPPRLARFDRVRNSGSGHPVIVATITAGPRSEIGKTVNIPLGSLDRRVLRTFLSITEER
jgi:hypothetical protein